MDKMRVMAALFLMLILFPPLKAEEGLGGVGDFVSSMARQAQGGTSIDLKGNISGILYIPVWTVQDLSKRAYLSLVAGGALKEGGRGEPLIGFAFNGPAISSCIWDFQWARDHLRRIQLPDIWFGPYIRIPLPNRNYVIGQEVGGLISIGFGKKSELAAPK